jgi:hypothetical protein
VGHFVVIIAIADDNSVQDKTARLETQNRFFVVGNHGMLLLLAPPTH